MAEERTPTKQLRSTAFHEAGHVVACYFLGVPFKCVTIVATQGARGHVHHSDPWLPAWLEKVKKARDRGAGGFADAPTRRWVESRVMMYLAGGLAHERAKSIESSGVSLGWGLGDGRDKANARDLLESLSSSNNEAGAYLSWLIAATRTMLALPDVWLAVDAVGRGAARAAHVVGQGGPPSDRLRPRGGGPAERCLELGVRRRVDAQQPACDLFVTSGASPLT